MAATGDIDQFANDGRVRIQSNWVASQVHKLTSRGIISNQTFGQESILDAIRFIEALAMINANPKSNLLKTRGFGQIQAVNGNIGARTNRVKESPDMQPRNIVEHTNGPFNSPMGRTEMDVRQHISPDINWINDKTRT